MLSPLDISDALLTTTDGLVIRAYENFVSPGRSAGPMFKKESFDIEGHVRANLLIYQALPITNQEKAACAFRARSLWNKLCEIGK